MLKKVEEWVESVKAVMSGHIITTLHLSGGKLKICVFEPGSWYVTRVVSPEEWGYNEFRYIGHEIIGVKDTYTPQEIAKKLLGDLHMWNRLWFMRRRRGVWLCCSNNDTEHRIRLEGYEFVSVKEVHYVG